ncbi:MAG: hypothetical protein RBJ76_24925 [Stenomitos frigidus ULC029]
MESPLRPNTHDRSILSSKAIAPPIDPPSIASCLYSYSLCTIDHRG